MFLPNVADGIATLWLADDLFIVADVMAKGHYFNFSSVID